MMIRILTALAAGVLLFTATPALAEDPGIPVTIEVMDPEGNPIPTAVVRNKDEADRHRVNTETGRWTGSVFYMPDGGEVAFEKGMVLEFEVSAPGYENAKIKYAVRKRKNLAPVVLKPMPPLDEEDGFDDPVIQFGRDKPLDK